MSKTGIEVMVDLSGSEGNAFVVMGIVGKILRQIDSKMDAKYKADAMSGDYENLLKVTNEYVDLIDTSNSYPEILGNVKVETTIIRD